MMGHLGLSDAFIMAIRKIERGDGILLKRLRDGIEDAMPGYWRLSSVGS